MSDQSQEKIIPGAPYLSFFLGPNSGDTLLIFLFGSGGFRFGFSVQKKFRADFLTDEQRGSIRLVKNLPGGFSVKVIQTN